MPGRQGRSVQGMGYSLPNRGPKQMAQFSSSSPSIPLLSEKFIISSTNSVKTELDGKVRVWIQ